MEILVFVNVTLTPTHSKAELYLLTLEEFSILTASETARQDRMPRQPFQ